MLDYLNMAGAIYLNGTLMHRDAQRAEPLSRETMASALISIKRLLVRAGRR